MKFGCVQFNFDTIFVICDLLANLGDNQNTFEIISGPKMCGNMVPTFSTRWSMKPENALKILENFYFTYLTLPNLTYTWL